MADSEFKNTGLKKSGEEIVFVEKVNGKAILTPVTFENYLPQPFLISGEDAISAGSIFSQPDETLAVFPDNRYYKVFQSSIHGIADDLRSKGYKVEEVKRVGVVIKSKPENEFLHLFFNANTLFELDDAYNNLLFFYGNEHIQQFLANNELPVDDQGLLNSLFYPQIIDEKTRLELQKQAISNKFGFNVFLAAVVGLQEAKFVDIKDYDYFIDSFKEYLQSVIKYNMEGEFYRVLTNRVLITFFSFPSTPASQGIYKAITPLLNYSKLQNTKHNLKLVLAKHEPTKLLSDANIGKDLFNEIIELKKFILDDSGTLISENRLKVSPHFSAVPELKDLKSEKKKHQT